MMASKNARTEVDLLIINNVPSFYKVNLYNALAQSCRIHVIFLALTDQAIIKDSFLHDMKFSYSLISRDKIEKRSIFRSFRELLRTSKGFSYRKLIFGGYADIEAVLLMFLTPKQKNCLQFESTIYESRVSGIKAWVKRIVFGRHSIALPAGVLHAEVFKALGFSGRIIKTHGVGLINRQELMSVKSLQRQKTSVSNVRYLYVGRLIEEKNLELLVRAFNACGKHLSIVGRGVLSARLKQIAKPNIVFKGFVPHDRIHEEYKQCDALILPSKSETWGLVWKKPFAPDCR